MLGQVTGWNGLKDSFESQQGFWFVTSYIVLIFFFSFFWTSMMFQPNDIANNLKENGSFIPGIRPGKNTARFLEDTTVRLTLAGSTFLSVIAVLPSVVRPATRVDQMLIYFMSGTSILIVVSVALDMVEKVNAMVIMRNYEGAMREGGTGGATGGWGRRAST